MTFNPEGLKIEINMSNNTRYIDTIMDYMPNKENLIALLKKNKDWLNV
jgi:hypothetical protein